jgi:hypothetical protein
MTKFENECKAQSDWEKKLGKWEYTTLKNGLIIPTYNPDKKVPE